MMPTPTTADRCSTHAAAELAGVTYRQADYWCRTGVLPHLRGHGSGSRRTWQPEDVVLLRVCGQLAALGATSEAMARVVALLRIFPPVSWGGLVYVGADGRVSDTGMPAGCSSAWVVDLEACLADLPLG